MMNEANQSYNPFTYQFSFSQIALSYLRDKPQYEVSEVLLFKKVPYNASELDILEFCKPFGSVEDICLIRTKGYAFVQFKDAKMAETCYEFFKFSEPRLKDTKLFIFYTGKHEIVKPEGQSLYPSRFILISLTNSTQNFNSELLERVVSKYGIPAKIMKLQETPFSAVFEMKDIEEAIRLKEGLHNLEIARATKIATSYISSKNFDLKALQKPTAIPFDRNCTSLDNSPVASPVYDNTDGFVEVFSDNISDSLYTLSRNNHQDTAPKTVMIRNLPTGIICEDLFKLFGMYGNVLKVKIFYKSPDTGLVQFQDHQQASLAKKFLNNCPLNGSAIIVSLSKSDINTNSTETTDFFKDFTHQKGQRYRQLGSKNFRNIAQPSKVLHLSNLHPEQDLQFYIDLFGTCGAVVNYMVLSSSSQNLLLEMESLQDAVSALVRFHNCEFDGKFLKVSFSKYDSIKYL